MLQLGSLGGDQAAGVVLADSAALFDDADGAVKDAAGFFWAAGACEFVGQALGFGVIALDQGEVGLGAGVLGAIAGRPFQGAAVFAELDVEIGRRILRGIGGFGWRFC